ncbi:peptidoglycan DD-metalloendopeptidase family protein [candidate division CSSED10-310 bacterium]|uniref:Peptidoglycan DD-metalloendopeptidase family protein n=1 Tax=candidate division CSSED10-310 bacterium TaxID=2855610 RepID=A0ABV6Z694_UNCC1
MRDIFAKKHVTLMILPHSHSEMKQLKIPYRLLLSLGIVSLLIFVLSTWFMYSYFSMVNRTELFEELEIENGQQKKEILAIADTINRLNVQMENLMVFSRRLQILMGLDNTGDSQKTGGLESNEIDRFSILYKKNQNILVDQIQSDIEQLHNDIPYQRTVHTYLNEIFEKNSALLTAIPSVSPVTGGWISSGFGMRNDPFTGRRKMHYGLDIAQDRNTPVYASANGVITYAKRSGGLGKLVAVDHGFGFSTRYAHLSIILVKFNQKVNRGDLIGRVGSTGRSKGLHLHYEVLIEGVPVDPQPFILDLFGE